MTTFQDGPAKGQTFMMRRAPVYLRVVQNTVSKKWDFLDQQEDEPASDEQVWAYLATRQATMMHIHASRGRGGFFKCCEYRLLPEQPNDAEIRDTDLWCRWVDARVAAGKDPLP